MRPTNLQGGPGYSACVYLVDYTKDAVYLAKREPGKVFGGQYAAPGGKWEHGDPDLRATAQREFKEETGITIPTAHLGFVHIVAVPAGYCAIFRVFTHDLTHVVHAGDAPVDGHTTPWEWHTRAAIDTHPEWYAECTGTIFNAPATKPFPDYPGKPMPHGPFVKPPTPGPRQKDRCPSAQVETHCLHIDPRPPRWMAWVLLLPNYYICCHCGGRQWRYGYVPAGSTL